MGRSTVFSDKDNKYPALHSDSRNEQNRRLNGQIKKNENWVNATEQITHPQIRNIKNHI